LWRGGGGGGGGLYATARHSKSRVETANSAEGPSSNSPVEESRKIRLTWHSDAERAESTGCGVRLIYIRRPGAPFPRPVPHGADPTE